MGILSGKYLSPDKGPTDARLNLFRGMTNLFTFVQAVKNASSWLVMFFFSGRYSEGESRYNLSNIIIKEATEVCQFFSLSITFMIYIKLH